MSELIKNAKQLPVIYYGLHMVPGPAEYREPGQEPYRILIDEPACKQMDPTFPGKPVYVRHVDGVDLAALQAEADGYVTESFYLPEDGKHWAKFIAVSDQAHDAIRQGWKLSNCYKPIELGGPGQYHGIDYQKEITKGEYEHLAIVNNPRYDESIILTPDQFKEYVEKKRGELKRLANSKDKQEKEPMFNLFTKKRVENSADFEQMSVTLPKSHRELTLTQLVNEADEYALKMDLPKMANGDDMVDVDGKKMKVNDLIDCYKKNALADLQKAAEEKKNAEDKAAEEKKNADEKAAEEKKNADAKAAEEKANAEMSEEDKAKKNAEDAFKAEEKKNADDKKALEDKQFNALKNAHLTPIKNEVSIDLGSDRSSRGKARYGSN
jgi:Tfp pilus assembly protein PilN